MRKDYRKILQRVKRIAEETLHPYPARVYLFGSWAEQRIRLSSDIDLGVDPETPLPRGTLSMLRERFEESHIPYRVEVVDLSRANPLFRKTVIREGILWNG